MDALIFTLMSGAERSLRAQQIHANNLANIETNGFRADLEIATSQAVERGYGYDARHMSNLQANAVSSRQGPMRQTGRELDVAIDGPGYLVVQFGDGEAYTRAGSFTLDQDGTLTLNGRPVLGDGGPIVVPEHTAIQIGEDGTISIRAAGQTEMQVVDKFDDSVRVRSGYLEGSNVSAIEEMVATMNLNREFEIQMKLYRAADAMAENGNRLIRE
jgi:flagellar basal-body rod protein FlgF